MKKIILIFGIIFFVIFMILFVGQSRFFLHTDIVDNPSDAVKQEEEIQQSQTEEEHVVR